MKQISYYYKIKPILPRWVQIFIRRWKIKYQRKHFTDVWPINPGIVNLLPINNIWPDNKKFAFVITHDVEMEIGQKKCLDLMNIEMELGFKSSFNFVPERNYKVSKDLRETLVQNGFEVGVHDLTHDGKLYQSKKIFDQRSIKINGYIKEWDSVGFRSGAMLHNLEWIKKLNIEYDSSTFDIDPFEPQPDGVNTIFPFLVDDSDPEKTYIELPLTLPQDFTIFILMKKKNIDLWKLKLDWIAKNSGMALLNVHPDYVNITGNKLKIDEFPIAYYKEFLNYMKSEYEGQYWNVLPREIAHYCRSTVINKIAHYKKVTINI